MNSEEYPAPFGFEYFAAVPGYEEGRAQQRLGGGAAQHNDQRRRDPVDLLRKPGTTSPYFGGTGRLVEAAFVQLNLRKLEMLDRVGEVHFSPIDSRLFKRRIQQLAGGPDKRMTGQVFAITGRLTHEHQGSLGGSFTENGLGSLEVERTSMAALDRFPHPRKGRPRRKKGRGAPGHYWPLHLGS